MKRQFHGSFLVIGVLVLGGSSRPLAAQQVSPLESPGVTVGGANCQCVRGNTGIPYSAEEVTETTQTLSDGTHIKRKRLEKVYRDSEGRTRREYFRAQTESEGQEDTPQSVRIVDPLAGVSHSLNPRDHTAQKTEMRRPTAPTPTPTTTVSGNPTPAPPASRESTREDLGTQEMEGVEVKGTRITTTIPAGAEGNDQPMQVTRENWYSPALIITMMRTTNDPRFGESVMHVTNLVRDEPPADLFQVPPDYTVVEIQAVEKPPAPSE